MLEYFGGLSQIKYFRMCRYWKLIYFKVKTTPCFPSGHHMVNCFLTYVYVCTYTYICKISIYTYI